MLLFQVRGLQVSQLKYLYCSSTHLSPFYTHFNATLLRCSLPTPPPPPFAARSPGEIKVNLQRYNIISPSLTRLFSLGFRSVTRSLPVSRRQTFRNGERQTSVSILSTCRSSPPTVCRLTCILFCFCLLSFCSHPSPHRSPVLNAASELFVHFHVSLFPPIAARSPGELQRLEKMSRLSPPSFLLLSVDLWMLTSVCTLGGGAACPPSRFCLISGFSFAHVCFFESLVFAWCLKIWFSILGSFSSLSNRKKRMTRVPKLLNCLLHTLCLNTKCVLLWLLGTHWCLSSASPPLHFLFQRDLQVSIPLLFPSLISRPGP